VVDDVFGAKARRIEATARLPAFRQPPGSAFTPFVTATFAITARRGKCPALSYTRRAVAPMAPRAPDAHDGRQLGKRQQSPEEGLRYKPETPATAAQLFAIF
jgi:hypothetical protein